MLLNWIWNIFQYNSRSRVEIGGNGANLLNICIYIIYWRYVRLFLDRVGRCSSLYRRQNKIFSFTRRWIEIKHLHKTCTLTDHNGLLLLSYIIYMFMLRNVLEICRGTEQNIHCFILYCSIVPYISFYMVKDY